MSKSAVVLLILLALLSGCKKKKPPVPAPQEQAPSITAPPPQPEPQPQPQPQPEAQPQPAPTVSEKPVTPAPKPKPRPKSSAKKPAPAPPASATAPKPEEKKNGAKPADTANTQLAADLPAGAAMQQRQTAAQLRATAETNLRSLARALSSDEKSMVQQIQYYLQQSRSAENDGDTERSYNLALKAQLLSKELVRR